MIELVAAVDGLLQAQTKADVDYFLKARNPLLGKGKTTESGMAFSRPTAGSTFSPGRNTHASGGHWEA